MPHRQMLERWMTKVGIELFVIINNSGRIIDSFGNKDLSISDEKQRLLLMQMALQSSMQGDYNEEFGKVRSCIVQRNKLKFICCPMGEDKTALVVANKTIPDIDIINHINQLANDTYIVAEGATLLV
jgi:hypothetical protein